MIVILMGVSGSGKTTIGTLLAERMHTSFADADDYHSAANKAKMAAGHPLDDQDRQPWLETLNSLLLQWFEAGKGGVLACSALKDEYRKTLVRGLPPNGYTFVLLDGSRELIAERMSAPTDKWLRIVSMGLLFTEDRYYPSAAAGRWVAGFRPRGLTGGI